ncbi:MAG TPA: hypothetical protein VG164_15460 [Trebonia sp.]|nr:hypothetical protein [Trebonia sp.]
MIAFLHLFEFAVIALAWRLLYVWRRPFREDGRRRLGARWANRAHLLVMQMIDDWRSR